MSEDDRTSNDKRNSEIQSEKAGPRDPDAEFGGTEARAKLEVSAGPDCAVSTKQILTLSIAFAVTREGYYGRST